MTRGYPRGAGYSAGRGAVAAAATAGGRSAISSSFAAFAARLPRKIPPPSPAAVAGGVIAGIAGGLLYNYFNGEETPAAVPPVVPPRFAPNSALTRVDYACRGLTWPQPTRGPVPYYSHVTYTIATNSIGCGNSLGTRGPHTIYPTIETRDAASTNWGIVRDHNLVVGPGRYMYGGFIEEVRVNGIPGTQYWMTYHLQNNTPASQPSGFRRGNTPMPGQSAPRDFTDRDGRNRSRVRPMPSVADRAVQGVRPLREHHGRGFGIIIGAPAAGAPPRSSGVTPRAGNAATGGDRAPPIVEPGPTPGTVVINIPIPDASTRPDSPTRPGVRPRYPATPREEPRAVPRPGTIVHPMTPFPGREIKGHATKRTMDLIANTVGQFGEAIDMTRCFMYASGNTYTDSRGREKVIPKSQWIDALGALAFGSATFSGHRGSARTIKARWSESTDEGLVTPSGKVLSWGDVGTRLAQCLITNHFEDMEIALRGKVTQSLASKGGLEIGPLGVESLLNALQGETPYGGTFNV